ncbi:MAG: PaaI family thioesterase [Rhodospirillales bacterium]|nr:PaaI family thioesterase [Rhodospirillales bacterium]
MEIDLDTNPFALTPEQLDRFNITFHSGYNKWTGLRMLEMRPGFARLTFTPRAEMLTPWGTLNGGVLNSLVEVSAFYALLPVLQPNELPVTNDIFLQHVRPLPNAEYELTGRVLRRGRTMAWLESTAWVGGKECTFARLTKTLVAQG